MKKIIILSIGIIILLGGLCLGVCPTQAIGSDCEGRSENCNQLAEQADKNEVQEKIIEPREVVTSNEEDSDPKIDPTFELATSDDDRTAKIKMGHNLFLFGNNLSVNAENKTGITFVAGNELSLSNKTEYGFAAGNTIEFSGETSRDLYLAGNSITLSKDAKIGRDVFVAANNLTVNTDIAGDLSVAANTVILKNVKISGNLNLDVDHVEFIGAVEILGALTYNDTAKVAGLDLVEYGSIEAYHVDEIHPAALVVAKIYSKVMSIIGLFLVMALICTVYKQLHRKIDAEANVSRFGMDLAVGLCTLVFIPVIAILAFFTYVAAPLGIVALLLYGLVVYLSQGFAGLWLGHLIVEKCFKSKSNIYLEAILGIILLGFLSLIPYIGVATGFVGLVLGLGLIVACVKPNQKTKEGAKQVSKKAA